MIVRITVEYDIEAGDDPDIENMTTGELLDGYDLCISELNNECLERRAVGHRIIKAAETIREDG